MQRARVQVYLAPVRSDAVTIAKSLIAHRDRAGTIRACRRGIRERADRSTCAAIVHVRIDVRLATVVRHEVAVGKRRRANIDFARAHEALRRGVREGTHSVTSAAILRVGLRVDLASVVRDVVAVRKTAFARTNTTCSALTNFVRVRQDARIVTSRAMIRGRQNVHFTAVLREQIAIGERSQTRPQRTHSRRTTRRRIRQPRTRHSTSTAVCRIRQGVRFTTVCRNQITIVKALVTTCQCTRATLALPRSIR